jgi:nicotinic acid mononucleotide adenylyltransferase
MVTLPTEKFARRLRSLSSAAAHDNLAFLSLSGSLNPIHTQHMRALEAAKEVVKSRGWTVVAGFLAPAGDEFLKEKLGIEAWSLEKRTRLCEVASSESDWVDVCSWGEFRSYKLCTALREYLEQEFPELKGYNLTGIEVMGSDAAIRILDANIADWDDADVRDAWYQGRVVCCLPRPGPTSASDMAHILDYTARRSADLGVELIVVDPESISPPLETVSSSEIRELLAAGCSERLRARGWVHPEVLDVLDRPIGGRAAPEEETLR